MPSEGAAKFLRMEGQAGLLFACAALAAGEACGLSAGRLSDTWPAVALAAACTALFGHAFALPLWKAAAVLLAGLALSMRVESSRIEAFDAATAGTAPVEAVFDVREPVSIGRPKDGARWVSFSTCFAGGRLRVVASVPAGGRTPAAGERWRCAGWISRKPGEGRRTPEMWARGRGSFARLESEPGPFSPRRLLARARAGLSRRMGIGLDHAPEAADLNRAILLGERWRLPRRLKDMFASAGVMHVFAVSGLHVMVVAQMLLAAMLLCGASLRGAVLPTLAALWAYAALIGMSPSATRAAAMASICHLAHLFWRRPDYLSAWAAAFIVFHVAEPSLLADVGSLLSFTVMLGIVLCGHVAVRARARATGFLLVTFAAWTAGTPIVAHVFGRITPGGLLANIVAIPVATLSVTFGALGAAASFVSQTLAEHLNNAAALCTKAMYGMAWAVSRIPFADVAVENWSVADCLAWYAVAGLAAFLAVSVVRRRASRL